MDNHLVAEESNAITELKTNISAYTLKLQNLTSGSALIALIAQDFKALVATYTKIGNHSFQTEDAVQDTYLLNFVLPEMFKDVQILHRDVFLEMHKVIVYDFENQITTAQKNQHFEQSKSTLDQALASFSKAIDAEYDKHNLVSKSLQKIKSKLSLQTNPWPIYLSQFEIIMRQMNEIAKVNSELLKNSKTFKTLSATTKNISNSHAEFIAKTLQGVQQLAKAIQDNEDVLSIIEAQLHLPLHSENNQLVFTTSINNEISQLSRLTVPVSYNEGVLLAREIDFNKQVQKWFDYKILPLLIDLISLETNLLNRHNLNLINLKNSIQLLKQQNNTENFKVIEAALAQLQDEIGVIKEKGELIAEAIDTKCNNQLLVSNLIKGLPFLEVPINSSLSVESNSLIDKTKTFLERSAAYLNLQYKESVKNDALSNLELSAECIIHRMQQDENQHYDSLFLSKNFLGDLFLVARKNQEAKLELILSQWKKGHNKSVLVSGERLSGRSTFIDYTTKKFFRKDIVVLQPNITATIDGRKFTTSCDLKEALDYIKNNNIKSTKPVVVIDDLELWRSKDHSLLNNVRALIDFMETASNGIFIMVSTTIHMKQHLDMRLDLSNKFTNTINCSKADKNEITEAIQLRHGAAHRNLVTEDMEVLSNQKIQYLVGRLSKQFHYNFGNVLQAWTYQTVVQEDDNVLFEESFFEFFDFFTPQERIVLKQALLFKRISEVGLKRVLSNAYDSEFKSALRRLINMSVLMRDLDGNLYINPVVVNDVSAILNPN